MAGMQYYFFPTDFYYPKPPPVGTVDPTPEHRLHHRHVALVNEPESGEQLEGAADTNSRTYKVPALTMRHVPTQKAAIKNKWSIRGFD